MKLGVFLDVRNPPAWRRPWADLYAQTVELVEEAERLGAESAWATEHHFFEDGYLTQPLTFLAGLATRTKTMRLGTAIVIAALRHPQHLAEEAALVDLLSGGRLELGFGAGYRIPEYEAFGADISRRMTLTDEATRAVRDLLWGGELLPPPVQEQIPMWLGYQGPQGARRAGVLGVGLLSLRRSLLDPYLEGLVAGGHDAGIARMGGVVDLIVADDPEMTAHELAPHYAYQVGSYLRSRTEGTDETPPPDPDPARLATQMTTAGAPGLAVRTADDAVALLRERTAGLPVEHVYLWGSVAGMPDHIVERHIELAFGTVRPQLS
ncbi:MAG: LLM class flavin-dependent oxidoreductase [Aquihabitans sp.]